MIAILVATINNRKVIMPIANFLIKVIMPCHKNVGYLLALEHKMAAHQIHCGRTSTVGSELVLARSTAAQAPLDPSSSSPDLGLS